MLVELRTVGRGGVGRWFSIDHHAGCLHLSISGCHGEGGVDGGRGRGGGRISCPLEAVDLKQICTDYEATFIDAQPDLLLEFFSHNFSHFSRIKVINFKRDIFCLEIKVKNFRGGTFFVLK